MSAGSGGSGPTLEWRTADLADVITVLGPSLRRLPFPPPSCTLAAMPTVLSESLRFPLRVSTYPTLFPMQFGTRDVDASTTAGSRSYVTMLAALPSACPTHTTSSRCSISRASAGYSRRLKSATELPPVSRLAPMSTRRTRRSLSVTSARSSTLSARERCVPASFGIRRSSYAS
jgi:hypothetical protein